MRLLNSPAGRALCPPAQVSKLEAGLRFTDILFGFVISQLFLRLLHWQTLTTFVQLQLITGTLLVLGSWIGFRRSLNRSGYEVKFFNLPFLRFLLDQGMVLLYFQVATRVPDSASPKISVAGVTRATIETLFLVYILYFLWDLLALRMAAVTRINDEGKEVLKYSRIDEKGNETGESARDGWGFGITAVFTALFALLYLLTRHHGIDTAGADARLGVAIGLLALYRFAKEVRTTFRPSRGASPAVSTQSAA